MLAFGASPTLASGSDRYERERRLGAALLGEPPHRDAHLAGLVGEVGGDARTGEGDDADGQGVEQLVVALEGRGVAMAGVAVATQWQTHCPCNPGWPRPQENAASP